MTKRHLLDEVDHLILTLIKTAISAGIAELTKRNVRHANIQIELERHIKAELKD